MLMNGFRNPEVPDSALDTSVHILVCAHLAQTKPERQGLESAS